MNDEELFNSAMTEAAPEIEAPAEPEANEGGQSRDEQGRFTAKAAEPEPEGQSESEAAAPQTTKDEAHVPSWRLREVNDAREAAERRAREIEDRYQRELADLRSRLPKQEAQAAPDLYEDPNGFVGHNVRQAVDPIKSEIGQMREYFSRRDAEREHGADKVQAAFAWLEEGSASRDPERFAIYQKAMQSMHPYGEIVKAHQERQLLQQIGSDPQKWFETSLEQKLQSDPQFAASLLQKIQQSARGAPQQQGSTVRLPPSLNRIASAQSAADASGDMSDASLFENAMR